MCWICRVILWFKSWKSKRPHPQVLSFHPIPNSQELLAALSGQLSKQCPKCLHQFHTGISGAVSLDGKPYRFVCPKCVGTEAAI